MFGSLTKLGLPDETLGLIKLQVRFLIIWDMLRLITLQAAKHGAVTYARITAEI